MCVVTWLIWHEALTVDKALNVNVATKKLLSSMILQHSTNHDHGLLVTILDVKYHFIFLQVPKTRCRIFMATLTFNH